MPMTLHEFQLDNYLLLQYMVCHSGDRVAAISPLINSENTGKNGHLFIKT